MRNITGRVKDFTFTENFQIDNVPAPSSPLSKIPLRDKTMKKSSARDRVENANKNKDPDAIFNLE